jgi:hypothetical protein
MYLVDKKETLPINEAHCLVGQKDFLLVDRVQYLVDRKETLLIRAGPYASGYPAAFSGGSPICNRGRVSPCLSGYPRIPGL